MQRVAARAVAEPQAQDVPAERVRGVSLRTKLALAASALAAGVAFRALYEFDPSGRVRSEVEGFFFEAADTSPWLVYGVAVWLFLQHRKRLAAAVREGRAARAACAVLGVSGAAAFVWSLHTGALDLRLVSFILTLLAGAAWLVGSAGVRAMALPALLLLFALPLPAALNNQIVYPLQLATVELCGWLLDLVGRNPILTGNRIYVGDHIFEVIETCSGIRSIHTLLMSTVVYAYLFCRSPVRATVLVLLAPPVAFLINSGRVLTVIFNPAAEVASVHTAQGVAALVAGVLIMALVELLLRRPWPDREKLDRNGGTESTESGSGERSSSALDLRSFALAGVLAGLAVVSFVLSPFEPESAPRSLNNLSVTLAGLRAKALRLERSFYGTVDFTEYVYRRYGEGERAVTVFVASDNRLHREHSVLSAKTRLPGSGWEITDRRAVTIDAVRGPVERLRLRFGSEEALAYHWREGVESLPIEVARASLAIDQSRFRRNEPARVIRLSSPISTTDLQSLVRAERKLHEMARVLVPALRALDERS